MGDTPLRIDLHVHSRFSKRPSQWILQKIGCPESFTDPALIYETAKKRGMDLVTISDHNTIDGALEIAHHDDTFISEEITTYFPDDGCKLHVLAWDITEAQHAEFQKLRENVFDLVPYLHEQNITHALAHPLFAVNDRLTLEHFEQALLLFDVLEANGSRDARQNESLQAVVNGLGPRLMERLADIHGIEPVSKTPWQKVIVGGSDDHSSINIARMHTRFNGKACVNGLKQAIADGTCAPAGEAATPRTMAHNLYGIATSSTCAGPTSRTPRGSTLSCASGKRFSTLRAPRTRAASSTASAASWAGARPRCTPFPPRTTTPCATRF